jgi:N-acylethanolamine-hydrolysing acid amidase
MLVALFAFVYTVASIQPVPQVSLDWSKPCSGYASAVAAVTGGTKEGYDSSIGAVLAFMHQDVFDPLPADTLSTLQVSLTKYHPDAMERLECIAGAINSIPGVQVNLTSLVGVAHYHELAHVASTSAARERRGGECLALISKSYVSHVRNMDADPVRGCQANTVAFDVVSPGGRAFRAVDWYWIGGGFETAVARGICSVQENWRFRNVTLSSVMDAFVSAGVRPQLFWFADWFSGYASTNVTSFDDCVAAASTSPAAAPLYVAVGGPVAGQGAIVTRGVDVVPTHTVTPMSSATPYGLVQSNYDQWLPDPSSDPRRTHAVALLTSFGAPASSTTQEQVIHFAVARSRSPVVAVNDTVYTVVMSAETGEATAFM